MKPGPLHIFIGSNPSGGEAKWGGCWAGGEEETDAALINTNPKFGVPLATPHLALHTGLLRM